MVLSLTPLSVLLQIGCCTVDPMYPGFDPSPLKAFLAALGVPYYFISEGIIEMAGEHMTRDSICAWCSVSHGMRFRSD